MANRLRFIFVCIGKARAAVCCGDFKRGTWDLGPLAIYLYLNLNYTAVSTIYFIEVLLLDAGILDL
jgi:hypothetical protein